MSEFSRKHPEMAAKLMTLAESGLTPDEIMNQFKMDDEAKEFANKKSTTEDFPDEIMLISQALAYRTATDSDFPALRGLLGSSYGAEVTGSEAFRSGDSISESSLRDLLNDSSYKWLLVEAPSGRDVEMDGAILGACCYSTDGISRRNGAQADLISIMILLVFLTL